MVNRMTVRERIILLVVVILIGILGGLIAFLATTNYYLNTNNSVYTEKVTERQIYLENSQSIQAVKIVSNSLVTIIEASKKTEYLELGDAYKTACFSIYSLDCGLNGVVLTSDGIVASVSQIGEEENKKLLAFDNSGHELGVDFLGRDDRNGLVLLQIYIPGEQAAVINNRTRNYSFTPISFAELKYLSVGQQMLILRGNIFNGLANLKQTVIASLLRANQVTNWPVVFSSDQTLTNFGLADATGAAGNVIADLNGGLVGLSSTQNNFINVEVIRNDLSKYKKNHFAKLAQQEFGLKVVRNSKQLSQNSNLAVDYGYIVSAVKLDSVAQKLGLKEKDLIVEIDGISLLYENLWDLLGPKIATEAITMRVIRGKETVELKGKF